ncbi:hypothetical protein [Tropicibacter sp. S64]|uniref:hypothetical protein n=1 Tax=Tropicibacter sp. S64 TaxID=3415122 RepID=UPI003C7A7252
MGNNVGKVGNLGLDGLDLDKDAQVRVKEALHQAIHFELAKSGQDPNAFFADGSVMGLTARTAWKNR